MKIKEMGGAEFTFNAVIPVEKGTKGSNRIHAKRGLHTRTKVIFGFLVVLLQLADSPHLLAQSGPPVPDIWPVNVFRFPDTNFTTVFGDVPKRADNVQLVESFQSYAARLGGNGPAFLQYNYVETNRPTEPSFSCTRGSVLLWYRPLADTSEASTNVLPFVELGDYGNSNGWLAWYMFSNHIYFAGASNGLSAVYLDFGPVSFASNEWVFLALNYSLTNSELYINGESVTNGGGVLYWPSDAYLSTNVISLGCNSAGDPVNGDLDFVCFFYGLTSDWQIFYHYTNILARFGEGGELSSMMEIEGEGIELLPGECGPYTLYPGGQVYLTNISLLGSNLCFSVAGGDTNQEYELFACTNLLGNSVTNSNRSWLARVATCQTYQLNDAFSMFGPSMYLMLGTTNDTDGDGLPDSFEMLVSHSSTNSTDSDGDGMSDGWEWRHFGNFGQTAAGDFDQDGLTNMEEFQNTNDPNTVVFSVRMGNQHFNTTNATGAFQVFKGVPSYWAVQVHSFNSSWTNWAPYNGQLAVPLGPTNGMYKVWFGLKGRAYDSKPTWMGTRVYLDQVAPSVVITSPATGVVTRPFIQVKGYATERLSCARYSISNALSVRTNLQAFLTGTVGPVGAQTNYFQCFDVALAEGANRVIITVADLASNLTSTTLDYVLNYSAATNPVVEMIWPPAGVAVGSSNIFLTGKIDDETASITLSNADWLIPLKALVERNGTFWIQNVNLLSLTNLLTMTISNAAGLVITTNFPVIQSMVRLSINPVPENQLNQQFVTVTGTVSDVTYQVQVNGTNATVDASGNWTATNVPVSSGGTALFTANATPGGGSPPGSAPVTLPAEQELPARIILTQGTWNFNQSYTHWPGNIEESSNTWNAIRDANETGGAGV